jgi:hypothetical protein
MKDFFVKAINYVNNFHQFDLKEKRLQWRTEDITDLLDNLNAVEKDHIVIRTIDLIYIVEKIASHSEDNMLNQYKKPKEEEK